MVFVEVGSEESDVLARLKGDGGDVDDIVVRK
jgi:hypothetical protein